MLHRERCLVLSHWPDQGFYIRRRFQQFLESTFLLHNKKQESPEAVDLASGMKSATIGREHSDSFLTSPKRG